MCKAKFERTKPRVASSISEGGKLEAAISCALSKLASELDKELNVVDKQRRLITYPTFKINKNSIYKCK